MNILYINHYAGSTKYGMEFRPYYLARKWVKDGHKVTIVGASFSHLRGKQPEVTGDMSFEQIDGIEYLWLKTNEYEGNGVGRIRNMMTFLSKLRKKKKMLALGVEPDVVIASSTYPLDIYTARKIAKMSGAKLVFELHDLWPMSPMVINGYSKRHPFITIMQRAEDYFCKHSDKVVSLLPRADLHLVERGMDPSKFHWISNGIAKEDWDNTEKIPEDMAAKIDELKGNGRFLVGYAGSHGPANMMDFFINAIGDMEKHGVTAVLVGTGSLKQELMDMAGRDNIDNVVFFDSIPKTQIPDFLGKMDCLYNGVDDSPLNQYGTSFNKIYDYMMAAKPIINVSTDVPNNTVEDEECGYNIENDAEILKEKILKIKDMALKERKAMGENGRRAVLTHYEYGNLADRFMNILEDMQR